ncbi:MAG: phytoene desaturase family protein, partial [Nocardioidaceae bacterium]
GAGLGGLAAAVTLAQQGRRPVVLEQGTAPGGYATAFQRGPYRFDAALHALNALAPGGGGDHLYRRLGIWDRLRLHRLDPLYAVVSGGRRFLAPADPFRFETDLALLFPEETDGIRGYLDEALAVHRDSRRLEIDTAAGRPTGDDDLVRRYPALTRASLETWEQMLTRHVASTGARAGLSALWGYVGLPPSRLAAIVGATMTASYHYYGAWYPEGGGQAVSAALVQALQACGGEIRYRQLVTGLEVRDGRVTGVTTAAGQHLAPELVVSNASAPSTMLHLVSGAHLPPDYAGQVARPRPGYTTFSVFLGLDRDLPAEQGLPHEVFLDLTDDPEVAWLAAQQGDWERTGISVTDYTRVDPGCAPPGHAVLVLTTVAPWDYQDVWGTGGDLTGYQDLPRYQAIKEHVSDVLLTRAADAVPGLLDAVRHREASTPLTNHRYTRNPGGAIEGYENTPDNSGLGWLPTATPVANLHLAGAWTTVGGMNATMAAGRAAALQAASAAASAAVPTA